MAVNIVEIGTVYDALETKIVGTLTTEYDAGRLKGKEYSEVMTAAISALISSSVTSVLEQPVKDAQVNLIEEQIAASISETAVKEAMKDAQVNLIEEQILASTADTIRNDAESIKKIALMTEQITASQADTNVKEAMKNAQVLDMKVKDYALLANTQKDIELKDMEIAKASKDALFIDAKINSLGIEDAIKQSQSVADVATKGAQLTLITAQTSGEHAKTLLTGRQKDYYDDQKMLKVLDSAANALGMYAAGDTLIPAGLENSFAARITTELA